MTESVVKYADLWDKATNAGSIEERIKRNEGWNVYFSTFAKGSNFEYSTEDNEEIRYLKSLGFLNNISSIIDIGCGIGEYDLRLSKYADITAFDMSEDSLEVLVTHANLAGIKNIKPVCNMWETYNTTEKFDLAFSSMCPAICNYTELKKFENLSNKYCSIITVAKGSCSNNRRKLRELITPNRLQGLSTEASYIYNLLYHLNKKPQIKYFYSEHTSKKESEQAKKSFKQYFSIFGFVGSEVNSIIDKFVDENSVNGYLEDKTTLNRAIITWRVK